MPVLDPQPIVAGLRGLFCKDAGRQALLQYAADRIRAAGAPYTSVYLYMLHGDLLELEAWSGRDTEHTRIPVGKGVCGTAVATGQDQNVPDVRAVGNYIAINDDVTDSGNSDRTGVDVMFDSVAVGKFDYIEVFSGFGRVNGIAVDVSNDDS